MDPKLKKELQKLKSENEELFDNGNYNDLLDIYNKQEGYTFAVQNPNQLKKFMDQIDYQTDLEKKIQIALLINKQSQVKRNLLWIN